MFTSNGFVEVLWVDTYTQCFIGLYYGHRAFDPRCGCADFQLNIGFPYGLALVESLTEA